MNTDGAVKLVTDVVDSEHENDEIFALSIAEDGFVEFLAFQEWCEVNQLKISKARSFLGISVLVNFFSENCVIFLTFQNDVSL